MVDRELREDRLVVAQCLRRRAVLVAKPAHEVRDFEAERGRAVRLVLQGLADDPGGQGLRPAVASKGDLARMLSALGRDEDIEKLLQLRRLIELERELGVGLGL